MLINVYQHRPRVIPGTRLLEETLGLIGAQLRDYKNPSRIWTVQGFYLPIAGRSVGGIRARLVDQKQYATFCNQKDFEVMVGLGVPGRLCPWNDSDYAGPGERNWYGFCCDDDDLLDDLFDREVLLRTQRPGGFLPAGDEIERRVHLSDGDDVEELLFLTMDADPETGVFPDPRFETLERRWLRAERRRVRWEKT